MLQIEAIIKLNRGHIVKLNIVRGTSGINLMSALLVSQMNIELVFQLECSAKLDIIHKLNLFNSDFKNK
jgi:hypothetical protein